MAEVAQETHKVIKVEAKGGRAIVQIECKKLAATTDRTAKTIGREHAMARLGQCAFKDFGRVSCRKEDGTVVEGGQENDNAIVQAALDGKVVAYMRELHYIARN